MRSHFHLNKTAYVVELNQLLSTGRQNQIWIHSGGQSDELTSRFVEQLEQFESSVKFARASRNDFPPSTVRVFKALDPNISAVLLTAFDSHISDPTYHSLFDQFSMTSHVDIEPTVTRLSDLALTLAKVYMSLSNAALKSVLLFIAPSVSLLFNHRTNGWTDGARIGLGAKSDAVFLPEGAHLSPL